MAGFGNWATLSGGGDSVTGLGSAFPSLGSLFGGSGSGGGMADDYYSSAAADYGARQAASSPYASAAADYGARQTAANDRSKAFASDPYGAAAADYGARQKAASSRASDVQYPRPGGTALGNTAMGDVGSWGKVPDLTQLWGNDGSFNTGLWDSFTGGTGMAPGGNSAGIFGSGGAAGGGMGGGGFDLGSLTSMFGGGGLSGMMGGLMGGGGGGGGVQQPTQSGPDPYQQAYDDLIQQIKDQQAAAKAAADAVKPDIRFAGGYTQDQLNQIDRASGLSAQEQVKAAIDRQNAPKAKAAVQAARTQDQIDADDKIDRTKAAQKNAAASGGAYDTEGNYYADTAQLKKAADDYNAKQAAAKAATDKLNGTAGVTGGSSTGTSSHAQPTPEQAKQNKLDTAKANGWGFNRQGHAVESADDVIDERPGHQSGSGSGAAAGSGSTSTQKKNPWDDAISSLFGGGSKGFW